MRQIIIGHSDSSKLGTYKIAIGKETLSAMQSNSEQRRVLKKPKRFRSAFTTEQSNYLEEQYKKSQYINREQRQHVASILKIGEKPIKIWFQNRRMKEKKENHKEFDFEICGNVQKFGNDQINDVPSANDHRLYSLPILSLTADTTVYANTNSMKANKVDSKAKMITKQTESPNSMTARIEQKISPLKANFYKEVNNQEHLSPYSHQQPMVDTTVSFKTDEKNKKSPIPSQEYKSITSAEFSINLCKKYKQQCASTDAAVFDNSVNEEQKMKKEPKHAPKSEKDHFGLNKDLPPRKKCKISHPPPPQLPTQINLKNSMYYPVMPNVYPPPMSSMPPSYVAADGVLWKPVNFMPVMATNPPAMNIGHQIPLTHAAHEQSKNCICNCHGSSQHIPVGFPPSLQNPYAQYVITVPFPNTSPSF